MDTNDTRTPAAHAAVAARKAREAEAAVGELRTLSANITGTPTSEQRSRLAELNHIIDDNLAGASLAADQVAVEAVSDSLKETRTMKHNDPAPYTPFSADRPEPVNMLEGRALLGGTATDGAEMVPDPVADKILDQIVLESNLAKLCTIYPMSSDTLLIPRSTTDAAAAWTAEGAAISSTEPQWDQLTLSASKSAALDTVSNELIADATPDVLEHLTRQHIRAHARALDAAIIAGTGSGQPLGLRVAGQSFGDTDLLNTAPDLDDVLANIEAAETAGLERAELTFVMHPRTWGDLQGLKQAVETAAYQLNANPAAPFQRSLFGVPVVLSTAVDITEDTGAESYWVLGAFSHYAIGVRKGVEVTTSTDYGFNTDTTAIRSILRVDGRASSSDAFYITDGIAAV